MSERQVPAEIVGLVYDCDECGEPMHFTGVALPVAPPLYRHVCDNKHLASLKQIYPAYGLVKVETSKDGDRPVWMPLP